MNFVVLGYILLAIIVLAFFAIQYVLYRYQDPISDPQKSITTASTITHSAIGTRGDMGNQLFQIACLIGAAESYHRIVLPSRIPSLPISELFDLSRYEVTEPPIDGTFYEYDNYRPIEVPSDGRTYDIRGYRQTYAYFANEIETVRKVFVPKESYLSIMKSVLPTNFIGVHIRKGDYIKAIHSIPLLREFARCELDYYRKGIERIRAIHPQWPVYVCSDNPSWAQSILSSLGSNAALAPIPKDISPKFADFVTLYLASAVVISNSTYSWWAAYLRPNRTVVAPSPWWDPAGFLGTALGLDGAYLHPPEWTIANASTGNLERPPYGISKANRDDETLNMYRVVRAAIM